VPNSGFGTTTRKILSGLPPAIGVFLALPQALQDFQDIQEGTTRPFLTIGGVPVPSSAFTGGTAGLLGDKFFEGDAAGESFSGLNIPTEKKTEYWNQFKRNKQFPELPNSPQDGFGTFGGSTSLR
jgi:hypothetical protein